MCFKGSKRRLKWHSGNQHYPSWITLKLHLINTLTLWHWSGNTQMKEFISSNILLKSITVLTMKGRNYRSKI